MGTMLRNLFLQTAMVAVQAPLGTVEHQIGTAARATGDPAALRAQQHGSVTAAIDEYEALFAAPQALAQRLQHARRDTGFALRLDHAVHGGKLRRLDGAAGKLQIAVMSGAGAMVTLERRRCRTENDGNAQLLRAEYRHVTRRITQAVLLLEGAVVFLVNDNQPQLE